MKRRILFGALAIVAANALVAVAVAQETKPANVSLRAGVFFPSKGETRDIGKSFFAGGIEFKFRDIATGSTDPAYTGALSLSLDYYGRNRFSAVPVLLNYVGRSNQFFYSVGAGVSFIHADFRTGRDFNRTRFGYQLGLGYDFKTTGANPFFVEAKYFGSSETAANGFGLYLGVRF